MDLISLEHADAPRIAEVAQQAAARLKAGQLVVFPTETVYGLAAVATSTEGYEALAQLKGHNGSYDPPMAVHLGDPRDAEAYLDLSAAMVRRVIDKMFPGPVTLLVDVSEAQIGRSLSLLGVSPEVGRRLYRDNRIALRCPDDPFAQALLEAVDEPVLATGASLPGQPAPVEAGAAAEQLGDRVGMIIDAGRTRYARPSTLVSLTHNEAGVPSVTVEQEGVFDQRFVQKLLRYTMLFVCSGNTCRSPMAEAIARHLLERQRGVQPGELEAIGIRVLSAGSFAGAGMPASQETLDVLRDMGIDGSAHRSRSLNLELIHEADVIFGMTRAHCEAVLSMDPSAASKIRMLDADGDIEDPIGCSLETYRRCAGRIRECVEQRLREQQL